MPFFAAEQFSPARLDEGGRQEFWSCLALRHCRGLGMRGLNILLNHFDSAYAAVQRVAEWGDLDISVQCASFLRGNAWREKARAEWDAARHYPAGVIFWSDEDYPAWLRSLSDAPPLLYFLGDRELFRNVAVAVVGRRDCSVEGLRATVHIARGIAEAGVTIVSGMARGVDRAAHLAGLEGPGGSIGVLGTGIDAISPVSNTDLFALMRNKGLLVSEYPPGFGASGRFFPVRNRIISGLARAVVVTEAAVRSGSLNTARHALEQDRELMAVPGPVTAASAKGCQELVRRGAKAVFSADDVLRELMPLLTAHARAAFEKRDGARFVPRREKGKGQKQKEDSGAEESRNQGALLPGLLPWNTSGTAEDISEFAARPASKKKTARLVEEQRTGAKERAFADEPVTAVGVTAAKRPDLTGLDAQVYALLEKEALHIDDICRRLGQGAGIISGLLIMLEVKGHIRRLPGMVYAVPH